MVYVRHIIGSVYICGILLLAITVLYHIFAGIIPSVLTSQVAPIVTFLDVWSLRISFPVEVIVNWALQYLTFLNSFIPVTNTGILGAQIHWIPLLALFVYTGILKYIDDTILKARVKKIKQNYEKQNTDKPRSLFEDEE